MAKSIEAAVKSGKKGRPGSKTSKPAPPVVLTPVRHRDGRVETVEAARAARLLDVGAAVPEAPWTREQGNAVLAAHAEQQERDVRTLTRDGLLVGAPGTIPLNPEPWPLSGGGLWLGSAAPWLS